MASPDDQLTERDRLQREILALENSLADDSNLREIILSDSDSAEDSDDSGHADEDVGYGDLEAERQKTQKEIEELKKSLGADAALVDALTDSEQDSEIDSSDEDEELKLPQDLNTCLELNLVYQKVIKEKLMELEHHLNENRQQQKEIEVQLSGSASTTAGVPHLRLFLGSFIKPYFKDKMTGLGPPANEETRERLSQGSNPSDIKIKRWEAWQKSLLLKAVSTDTMKRMLQPKMFKVEYLTTKMSRVGDKEKEELEKQISIVEKEIKEISSMKDEELYGARYADHDWDKISNIDFEGLRTPDDLMRFWQNFLHPSINKSEWKQDELDKLADIAKQYKESHWDKIAEALGTNRSAFMCFQTYQRYISKTFKKHEWTKEEDQVLIDLVEKMRVGNYIPYTQMSYFMEGRDYTQLIYRWTTVLNPSIKRGPWSKEEDELLRNAVKKHGCKNWWKIKDEVPGRTDNSCRDRYLDCLREDVKRGQWSSEEVELLKNLVKKHGVGKWSKIAAEIPNRVDAQCLNKWRSMKKLSSYGEESMTNLRQEPQRKRRKLKQRRTIKKENDCESMSESSSEDETASVQYISSDTENENTEEESEEQLEPRREYVQLDIEEWIPVSVMPNAAEYVKQTLVNLSFNEEDQTFGESHRNLSLNTVLDNLGTPVKTFRGIDPPALQKWDFANENAMLKVSGSDVKSLLVWMRNTAVKKKAPITKSTQSKALNEDKGMTEIKRQKRRRRVISSVSVNLQFALMIAISPWVGNILMSVPFEDRAVCKADEIRKRGAAGPLTKTPLFSVFLEIFHIDSEGCKKVIEARKQTNFSITDQNPKSASSPHIRTVKRMLSERQQLEECNSSLAKLQNVPALSSNIPQPINLTEQRNAPQVYPAQQMLRPALIIPQNFVIAQPNVHQGLRPTSPVVQGIVPLSVPGAQGTSQVPQTFLQMAVPGKLAPQSNSPTITTSSSANESPKDNSNERETRKRKRVCTIKGQALKETMHKNNASKMKSKPINESSRKNVPLLPQPTAWILTPAGLVPVVGLQMVTCPTSLNLNQPSTAPVNLGVSTPQVPGLTPTVASTDPINPAVSTAVNGSTVHTPPSSIACSQNQGLLGVPAIQSPLLVNQNACLSNFVNPINTAQSSVGNSASISNSVGVPGSNVAKSPTVPVSDPNISVDTRTSSVTTKSTDPEVLPSANGATQEISQPPINTSTHDSGISQILPMPNSKNLPNSEILQISQSSAATATPGTLQGLVANGPRLPVNYNMFLPVQIPPVPIGANSPLRPITPSLQIRPPAVVLQILSQDKMPTLQSPALTFQLNPLPSALNFDPNLMFLEHPTKVKPWISGEGGIPVPHLDKKMPYLPPFSDSINTLASLLRVKESLLRTAESILPEADRKKSDENKIAAVRQIVSKRCQNNPAYLLLKARFLSCFTLPAFLATINPNKEDTEAEDKEEEEGETTDQLNWNEDQCPPQTEESLLTNESEASAPQLLRLRPRRKKQSRN